MIRTIIDTTGIFTILCIAAIGFAPGIIPAITEAWAKDPNGLMAFAAQVFTSVWMFLVSTIFVSRKLLPALESLVRLRINEKKAVNANVADK